MIRNVLFAAAVVAGSFGAAQAATIVNGSFEDGADPGVFSTLGAGNTNISGWSIEGNGSIDYIGSYWNASEGARSIDLNGGSSGATLYQEITDLVVGHAYRLWFDLSGNTDGDPTIKTSLNGVTGNMALFQSSSSTLIPGLTWTTYSLDFVALATSTKLSFTSQDAGAYGAALDNVRIGAVPVPAAAPLLLAGLAGLGMLKRRRKV